MSLNLIDSWKEEVAKILPPDLRAQSMVDWLGSLVHPLESTKVEIEALELDKRQRLRYNGQIMVLQAALDEQFGDGSPPFIRIETNRDAIAVPSFMYDESDGIPTMFMYEEGTDPSTEYMTTDPQDGNQIPSFRVLVPNAIYTEALADKIRAEVDLYKIAGKTYEIITY